MSQKLLLGPLLSIENDGIYSCCVLTEKPISQLHFNCRGKSFSFQLISETLTGKFWKVQVPVGELVKGQRVAYTLLADQVVMVDQQKRASWSFYIPNDDEAPLISYTSCNGFSSAQLMKDTNDPYALWREMNLLNQQHPYSLMIMGGDQLYADSIWTEIESLKQLIEKTKEEIIAFQPDVALEQEIDLFYEQLYLKRWNEAETSLALASIPQIMMWDDHDIFDGWGSYPEEINNCPLYQTIFTYARKHFALFQLRSRNGMLSQRGTHHAYYLHFSNYTILAMDHRSERTIQQVMSKAQWADCLTWMKEVELRKNLLVMSGVPVVYRDFSFVERTVEVTSKEEEVTDDLKDHWRAKEHLGERLKFINMLLSELRVRQTRYTASQTNKSVWHVSSTARTVIMSGDVHIGALGVIMDRRITPEVKVYQVVSSAIVHPPPTWLQWTAIRTATNDRNEYLTDDKKVETAMITPVGSNTYIRARNYATLQEGNDGKLWVNWINESDDKAEYPLE